MRSLILVAVLFLSACAPQIVNTPVPIDMPVSAPCKSPAVPAPDFATKDVTSDTPLDEQVGALATANEQHKIYEAKLVLRQKACQ